MVENIVQVYQVQCSALTNKVAEENLNEVQLIFPGTVIDASVITI